MKRTLHSLALIMLLVAASTQAADDISEAEHRIFLDHHLANVKPGTVLRYSFHQTGADAASSFDDRASLTVAAAPKDGDADSRQVSVQYLSGAHAFALPELDAVESNPVILYFLETDIREMHRALGGNASYFQKRIRMALAQSAQIRPVKLSYGGHSVEGSEISISPYVDDALKDRLKNFVGKRYVFTISDQVPGAVYRIETDSPGPDKAATPELRSQLTLDAG